MDPLLGGALATGAADFIGGLFANRGNRREAEKNRDFQERMSSTAAQRAVKDYQAAGLNPALAYDRPASSPGGSQAQVENPVGRAISSGLSARAASQQVQVNQAAMEKMQAETAKTKVDGANALAQGELLSQQRLLNGQDLALRIAMQPHQVRGAALANMSSSLGLSKAEAESSYYKMMGAWAPAVDQLSGPVGMAAGGVGLAASLLRGRAGMATSSAKSVLGSRMFKAPVPKRTGDWERAKPKPVRPPAGFQPNSPP